MDFQDSKVLVTGGAGFIGSHLTEKLLKKGATVRVGDNFSRGGLRNIESFAGEIEIFPVDLTAFDGCIKATEEVDHVFHLAASVGGIHYIQSENIGGLTPSVLMNQNMLEASRLNDVDNFVFSSSACIYRQEHDDLNLFSEDQAFPADPDSTYGWAKILGEVACKAYHEDSNLDTGSARLFNVYGPRESLDPGSSHVIPSLCRKVAEESDGGSIEIFGDGSQERGFIYVIDAVDGLLKILEDTDGDALNLGNSKEVVSINELVDRIIEISGKDLRIEHDTSKPTGTDRYAADMSRMKSQLDWEPKVTLDEGLEIMYRWVEDRVGERSPLDTSPETDAGGSSTVEKRKDDSMERCKDE